MQDDLDTSAGNVGPLYPTRKCRLALPCKRLRCSMGDPAGRVASSAGSFLGSAAYCAEDSPSLLDDRDLPKGFERTSLTPLHRLYDDGHTVPSARRFITQSNFLTVGARLLAFARFPSSRSEGHCARNVSGASKPRSRKVSPAIRIVSPSSTSTWPELRGKAFAIDVARARMRQRGQRIELLS